MTESCKGGMSPSLTFQTSYLVRLSARAGAVDEESSPRRPGRAEKACRTGKDGTGGHHARARMMFRGKRLMGSTLRSPDLLQEFACGPRVGRPIQSRNVHQAGYADEAEAAKGGAPL